jgi:hypothetical protein
MGQCNFAIAPVIYHFRIFYISFANLKNFGFLRLHRDSRYLKSNQGVGFLWLIYNLSKTLSESKLAITGEI